MLKGSRRGRLFRSPILATIPLAEDPLEDVVVSDVSSRRRFSPPFTLGTVGTRQGTIPVPYLPFNLAIAVDADCKFFVTTRRSL